MTDERMSTDAPAYSSEYGHDLPVSHHAAEISRLASLSPLEYERERSAVAQILGLRTTALDKIVREERRGTAETGGQGRALNLPSPEPWPAPVDGNAMMSEMVAAIRSHVVATDGAAEAIGLWVLHAHALDAFSISPRLGITSPEKGCGKTTCLDVVSCLVPRRLPVSNISPAAIFRTIETACPTLLIDEADTFLINNDEMRGVLNSGHRRSAASVIRLVGDDHQPRMFSTWAATAIAMIGRLPETLEDRSIAITLRRRRPDETVVPLRADRTPHLDRCASMAARWGADNIDALRLADPMVPAGLANRAADNWRPLLAVADAIGGEWPERARRIAGAMVATGGEEEAQSPKVMVLDDIRAVFEDAQTDRLPSATLVAALVEMEARPWCEWKHGKPLSQNSLARLLAPFAISPSTIRHLGTTAKGYHRAQFADAFARYLTPATKTDTPTQSPDFRVIPGDAQPAQSDTRVGSEKSGKPGLARLVAV